MKIEAHLDRTEVEQIKAEIDALEERIANVAGLMDSLTEHLWKLKHETAPIWLELMNEESEDELHG